MRHIGFMFPLTRRRVFYLLQRVVYAAKTADLLGSISLTLSTPGSRKTRLLRLLQLVMRIAAVTNSYQRPEDMKAQFDRCAPQFSTPSPMEQEQLTDKAVRKEDTDRMSNITREELDAKLAMTEARMDARLERFDKDMRQVVSDFRLEVQPLKSMKADLRSATGIIVGTVIATAVAVASLSFGAFDSGRETSQLVEQAKQQSAENRKLLDQIEEKLKSIPTQPTSLKNFNDSGVMPKP